MKKLAIVLSVFLGLSSTAYAWGDREQGALTALGTIWLLNQVNKNGSVVQEPQIIHQQRSVIIQQSPVIVDPVIVPRRVEYYNCLIRVYDPRIGAFRNEVMTCVR